MTRAARLLVSGVGKRNQLLRLLAEECSQVGMQLVGCDASPLAPARSETPYFEEVPLARDSEFGDRYRSLIEEYDVTGFLSLIDPEIPILSELATLGALGQAVSAHPGPEIATICEDKFAFHETMKELDIPSVPTSLEPVFDPPYIRKDRSGSASSGFRVLTEAAVFDTTLESGSGEPIYQPFCEGQHYCVDAYFSCFTGELIDFCVKEVLSKQAGETYLMRSVDPGFVRGVLGAIEARFPMRGIVNLDIYRFDDAVAVMEINCRVGGNYPAAQAFGVNLLRPLVREIVSGEAQVRAPSPYRPGVFVSKYFGFSEAYPWPTA